MLAATALAAVLGGVHTGVADSRPSRDPELIRARERGPHVFVQPGTSDEAEAYYSRISDSLKFPFLSSTLDSLLSYLGYSRVEGNGETAVFRGLRAEDLETLDSFLLMPESRSDFERLARSVADPDGFRSLLGRRDFQKDRVLVSRFFAPKIATYFKKDPFQPIRPGEITPGWRKVVRLTPRCGSIADSVGVKHVYVLFNFKQADPDIDPYLGNESGNNQIIVVPEDQQASDAAYFAVYQSRSKGYPIGLFLAADFDLPGYSDKTTPGAKDGEYFVPRACAECHGHSGIVGDDVLRGEPIGEDGEPTTDFSKGVYKYAKPNYLDTDQWYDWMEYDYPGVAASLNDVVFDGSRDHGSKQYARAMDVVRTLNSDIRDQTFEAEHVRGTKSYSTLAAEKWLTLHDSDDQRKPIAMRSIGAQAWDTGKLDEMKLLRKLNNHCFRCHSSLRYNVFDRQAVESLKGTIQFYMTLEVKDKNNKRLPGFFMPQGRVLADSERQEILELLNKVFPDG